MKRNQKKFLMQLQAKINAFILELTTISKVLQACDNANCPNGCNLGYTTEYVHLIENPTSSKLQQLDLCDNPNCPNGCSLGEIETCDNANCPNGCSLGEVEVCDNKNCPNGCSLGEEITLEGNHHHHHHHHHEHYENSTQFGGSDNDGGDNKTGEKQAKCGCGCDYDERICADDQCHKEHCTCGCEDENCECEEECCCDDDCSCHSKETEYLNLARQIQADFDNYRKRNVEAIKQAQIEGTKNVLSDFLPILDTINKAVHLVQDEQAKHGLELIKTSFESALQKVGVEPINALGLHYDPKYHNVVLTEESDSESGTIIEELEKGYTYQGAVIKHSIVKISK